MKAKLKNLIKRDIFKALVASLVSAAVISVTSVLFLRNFYRLLAFDPQFYAIFEQISFKSTKIFPPFFLLFLLSLGLSFALIKLWRKGLKGRIIGVFSGIFGLILLLIIGIMLSCVNKIMFFYVVRTLVPLLTSGVL